MIKQYGTATIICALTTLSGGAGAAGESLVLIGTPAGDVMSLESDGTRTLANIEGGVSAITQHGADLLVATRAGDVVRVDPVSGDVIETVASSVGEHGVTALAIYANDLFLSRNDEPPVVRITLETGQEVNTYYHGLDVNTIAVQNGRIFAGSSDGIVTAVVGTTGVQELAAMDNLCCIATGRGDVFVGTSDREVHRLDNRGNMLGSFVTRADADMVMLHDGDIVVADRDGQVDRYDTQGRHLSTLTVDDAIAAIGRFDVSYNVSTANVGRIAFEGEPVPGQPDGTTYALLRSNVSQAGMGPNIDAGGHLAFSAFLERPDGTVVSAFLEADDQVSVVLADGDMKSVGLDGSDEPVFITELYDLVFPPEVANGRLSFQVIVGDPVSPDNSYLTSEAGTLEVVARAFEQAPGIAPGGVFRTPLGLLNGLGASLVVADLSGDGITTANNRGVWVQRNGNLALLAREGEQAPGTGTGVHFANGHLGSTPTPFPFVKLTDGGNAIVRANLDGPGVHNGNDEALYIERHGQLTLLIREGQQAPGMPAGVTIGGNSVSLLLQDVAHNARGDAAFNLRLGGDLPTTSATLLHRDGITETVLVPGHPFPGSSEIVGLVGRPAINNNGRLAIRHAESDEPSGLAWGGLTFALWTDHNGGFERALAPGDDVSFGETGVILGSVDDILSYNDDRMTLLISVEHPSRGPERGVAAFSLDTGVLDILVLTGEVFDIGVSSTDLRTISNLHRARANASGTVAVSLQFEHAETGYFTFASPTTVTACACERDGNPGMSTSDLLSYLAEWFQGSPNAEMDGNPGIAVTDLLEFLSCWLSASETSCI